MKAKKNTHTTKRILVKFILLLMTVLSHFSQSKIFCTPVSAGWYEDLNVTEKNEVELQHQDDADVIVMPNSATKSVEENDSRQSSNQSEVTEGLVIKDNKLILFVNNLIDRVINQPIKLIRSTMVQFLTHVRQGISFFIQDFKNLLESAFEPQSEKLDGEKTATIFGYNYQNNQTYMQYQNPKKRVYRKNIGISIKNFFASILSIFPEWMTGDQERQAGWQDYQVSDFSSYEEIQKVENNDQRREIKLAYIGEKNPFEVSEEKIKWSEVELDWLNSLLQKLPKDYTDNQGLKEIKRVSSSKNENFCASYRMFDGSLSLSYDFERASKKNKACDPSYGRTGREEFEVVLLHEMTHAYMQANPQKESLFKDISWKEGDKKWQGDNIYFWNEKGDIIYSGQELSRNQTIDQDFVNRYAGKPFGVRTFIAPSYEAYKEDIAETVAYYRFIPERFENVSEDSLLNLKQDFLAEHLDIVKK